VIIIAHFWLRDEEKSKGRAAGRLLMGFAGVVVLVRRTSKRSRQGDIWGELAVLLATVSYAVALVFSRRHLRGTKPVVQSTMILVVASALMWIIMPVADRPVVFPATPLTWIAVIWLGVLGLCVAYLLFFYLNNV
jgi:drug/metabolite transporter (DMT)-like permease